MNVIHRSRERLRRRLLDFTPVHAFWSAYRRRELLAAYRMRREKYEGIARERGLAYSEAASIQAVRNRLAARGWTPQTTAIGSVHTFAFIPDIGWHNSLLPDLRELGPVTRFDYVAEGFDVRDFLSVSRKGLAERKRMNELVLPALRAAHARRPVDWVFVYAGGVEVAASTIRGITEEMGIPVVNLCLDDKQSWEGPWVGDHRAGQVDLARHFDLVMTSARIACQWYLVEDGRPLYMPEGVDKSFFRGAAEQCDIPVSFVGAAYGFRPAVVRDLREHGIPLQTFGARWSDGVWVDDSVSIFQRSRINLGMGGIGYSEELTNVKGRDFEIPAVGGGVYLTSYNSDLAQHFVVGDEILCYRTRDEMIELIRYYLAHEQEARAIAHRGRARCERDHRWLHRYLKICTALGILEGGESHESN